MHFAELCAMVGPSATWLRFQVHSPDAYKFLSMGCGVSMQFIMTQQLLLLLLLLLLL